MKLKLVPLLLMFFLLVSLSQPIFAVRPGDTQIVDLKCQPLEDMTVKSGDFVKFSAGLDEYVSDDFHQECYWELKQLRYLEFYVYRSNADGTNGDQVYSDVAQTGLFLPWASPNACLLVQKGNYTL